MPGLTCFLASPSPEALGQICHPYLEVCPVLLYPELLERDQCSELSEALCKATGKVTAVTCSTCKSSHSLGNKTAMNAYQGFEDAKLCRSAKFRKSPLKSTTGNKRPLPQTVIAKKQPNTVKQGGAVAALLLSRWQ